MLSSLGFLSFHRSLCYVFQCCVLWLYFLTVPFFHTHNITRPVCRHCLTCSDIGHSGNWSQRSFTYRVPAYVSY